MDCQHLIGSRCRLVVIDNPPCRMCQRQWPHGKPPTEPTPVLRYAAKHPPKTLGQRRVVVRKAKRKPHQCDHAGKRLKKGPTCGTSVYECDVHGEATCAKCATCPDFVPVDALTMP